MNELTRQTKFTTENADIAKADIDQDGKCY